MLKKQDRVQIGELFAEGFDINELALMYNVSIFRIMSVLERFGIEV